MSQHMQTETNAETLPLTGHIGVSAKDRLRSIVDRIEHLKDEQKATGDDIKDLFLEARAAGYDVKALRQLLKIRRQDPAELEQLELTLDSYRLQLGMG